MEFGGLEKTVLERFGSAGTDLKRVFDSGARQVYEQDYLYKNRIQPDFGQVSSCQRVKEGHGPQVLSSASLQKNTDANRRKTEIWYMAFWKLRGLTWLVFYFRVSLCVRMLAAVSACVAEAVWPVWPIGIVDQFGLTVLILGFPLPVDVAPIRLWLYMIYYKHATCICIYIYIVEPHPLCNFLSLSSKVH